MDFPVLFTGTVITGNRLGRTIGFPTINLAVDETQIRTLAQGVYAARVLYNGKLYDGMANLGTRPTIEDNRLLLEVNLFDFSEDTYGKPVTVYLYEYIREEKKYAGLEELQEQIALDKKVIEKILLMKPHPDPDAQ